MIKSNELAKKYFESYKDSYKLFLDASWNVEKYQRKKLMEIIRKNIGSKFGINHSFADIKSIKDFQKNVRIMNYDEYSATIQEISSENQGILTSEDVLLFEPTSGSASNSKLIPYTESLRIDFVRGIGPWLFSDYKMHEDAMIGTHYWSISPISKSKSAQMKNGIKIGFDDDSSYLGNMGDEFFAIPKEIKYVNNLKTFKYLTQLFLAKNRNLSFISLWNPSMLEIIMDDFERNLPSICRDIASGRFNNNLQIQDRVKDALLKSIVPDKERSEEIMKILKVNYNNRDLFNKILPNLKLISCWTHGNAKLSLAYVQEKFPNCKIEGKGLIATECIVSIPFESSSFPVISVLSHFFEFIELDNKMNTTNKVLLTHQLKKNKYYGVVVTTSGGLYRYNLNDVILVRGFYNNLPQIEFIGRLDNVSDIMGEKLNEIHVKESIKAVLKKNKLNPKFVMLAPERKGNTVFYTLFIECASLNCDMATNLDKELKKNYHYAYCRKIGQLKELRIFQIDSQASKNYMCKKAKSIKMGNVKQTFLSRELDWQNKFKGRYVCEKTN
jgi:hypothetical protein